MDRYAIWYESRLGRNDGNPLYVWNSLKKLQNQNLLEVDHLAPVGDYSVHGLYDAHIWVDWGEDGLNGILPYEPIYPPGKPLVYWASDTHLGYDYRLKCAKEADIVFVAQKDAVERMKADGVNNPIWLPHAFEPEAYPKFNYAEKKFDVCFVGHINSENRLEALDKLFKAFPNFYFGQKRFDEASQKFNQSKICFNIAMKNDINMRCFEIMGSGSFLLTDRIPHIEELMTDGVHCVLYDGLNDMIDKARYYIEHDEERQKIALAGYEHALKNHTMDNRVSVILNEIKKFKENLCLEPQIQHI